MPISRELVTTNIGIHADWLHQAMAVEALFVFPAAERHLDAGDCRLIPPEATRMDHPLHPHFSKEPIAAAVAVAVAHVTQCPWCIRSHTRLAMERGVTDAELMEAIRVAAEMRAGAEYARSVIAIGAMNEVRATSAGS